MNNRRDWFALLGAGLLMGKASAAPAGLADAVLEAGESKLVREPFGDLRIYFDGSTEQLQVLTAGSLQLKPGMSPHPPHRHPEEEILLVTEGSGEILLNDDTIPCGPGAMMYCAADHLHGIENTGKAPLTFFFFKWIKRG